MLGACVITATMNVFHACMPYFYIMTHLEFYQTTKREIQRSTYNHALEENKYFITFLNQEKEKYR